MRIVSYATFFCAGVSQLFAAGSGASVPSSSVAGTFKSEMYTWEGKVKSSTSGQYAMGRSDRGFQLTMLTEGSGSTDRYLATSDYKEIFYSQRLEGPKVTITGTPMYWGYFERGSMPNKFPLWMVTQAVILSHLLAADPGRAVKGSELSTDVIPGFVWRRTNDLSNILPIELRTRVSTDRRVAEFWHVKKDARGAEMTAQNSYLLAKVEVLDLHGDLPTRIRLVHNHPNPGREEGEFARALPVSIVEITGAPSAGSKEDIFAASGCEPGYPASVNDLRFGSQLGYTLIPGESPAFAGSPGYAAVSAKASRAMEKDAGVATKRSMVSTLIILSLIPLWIALRRGPNSNKPIPT